MQPCNDIETVISFAELILTVVGGEKVMIGGYACFADEQTAPKHELVTLAVHPGGEILMRLVVVQGHVQSLNHPPML